jgi:hypothetical protein
MKIEDLKITSGIKKFILVILTMAIIMGGLYFDVRETREAAGN